MAFLANRELKKLLKDCVLEGKFNPVRIQNASYELSLGDEIYTNNDSTKTVLTGNNSQFELKSGQFAILITDEKIEIPPEYVGFISLKFGFKFKGLVNISGFHVDPGFKGKLKFSVYNAGSSSIILDKGAPYFVLWISELTSKLKPEEIYDGTHQGQNSITANDIMKIKGDLSSPNELRKRIEENVQGINKNNDKVSSFLTTLKWISGIVIGLLLTLNLAIWSKYKENDKAFRNGLKEKDAIFEVQKTMNGINFDSIIISNIKPELSALGDKLKLESNVKIQRVIDSIIEQNKQKIDKQNRP